LLNDLVQTSSADECRERCRNHTSPKYPEDCKTWSWMSRRSHRFYGRCHLMAQDISFGKADLKFVSGSCEGPAANTTSTDLGVFGYGIEVGTLCGRIMADVDSLRVWLAVKENVNLDASSLADLYAILEMVEICPLDDEFGE